MANTTIASYSEIISVQNPDVRRELLKAAFWMNVGDFNQSQIHLKAARKAIRLSLPIDYTPKKVVADDWDAFGQQAPKQQLDVEDLILPRVYVDSMEVNESRLLSAAGRSKNSKSKAKWNRSGKAARVLSNR